MVLRIFDLIRGELGLLGSWFWAQQTVVGHISWAVHVPHLDLFFFFKNKKKVTFSPVERERRGAMWRNLNDSKKISFIFYFFFPFWILPCTTCTIL
jgi:hypothetical protein